MKKTCFKCGQEKDISEFYRHSRMADGHLNKCKSCTKRDVNENRAKRIDYYRAYEVVRAKTPKRRQLAAKVSARWRDADPRRTRSHNMVHRAVKAGKLAPKPCEVCGRHDVHAHHDSYDRPLDVMWLCPIHHHARHADLAAAGQEP